jgi:hypothetical protein
MDKSDNALRTERKLHVATTKGCNSATFSDDTAILSATTMQHPSLIALSGAVLERNASCNQGATPSRKECNFQPQNDPQKLHSFDAVAESNLTMIAKELDWPLTDLLDFYQSDMTDLESMSMDEVRFIVQDYITNYTACRDEPDPKLLTLSREMKP